MYRIGIGRPNVPAFGRWIVSLLLTLTSAAFVVSAAWAQDNEATKILKAMSDYVIGQKSFSAKFDADIEVVTPEIQKIQFASSGEVLVDRPGRLRVTRKGGYADVELVFDGKTVSVLGKHENAYAQADAPATIDQLVDLLRDKYAVDMPGADLLLSNAYLVLSEDILDAKYIGHAVIDGVESDHLAFRNQDTDWQIWVERGERPIPRKYVITSKAVAGAPQYTLRITEWKSDAQIDSNAFEFKPPAEAKKVEIEALSGIDEVPAGVVEGEAK
jgi:hypothetical protein